MKVVPVVGVVFTGLLLGVAGGDLVGQRMTRGISAGAPVSALTLLESGSSPGSVPEHATLLLLGSGLFGMGLFVRRRIS